MLPVLLPEAARRATQRLRLRASTTRLLLLLALLLALTTPGRAQGPAWTSVLSFQQAGPNGTAVTQATALNADGDVLVVGTFTGRVEFGATQLSSAGGSDVFLAKYTTATNTWAWAQAAGGTGADTGLGLALSGSTVYLTGAVTNTSAGTQAVRFGGALLDGRGSTANTDLYVACYTDAGSSATYNWAVAAGGTGADQGTALAVSGTSVYATGSLTNNTANAQAVQVGGATLAGASATSSPDVVLASYLDQASAPVYQWAVVGGGTGADQGTAVAANGLAVYVAGFVTNNGASANAVKFGGVALAGASSNASASVAASTDMFVARYTSTALGATYGWAVAGGGTGADQANGLAVSGTAVYVTGTYTNTSTNAQAVRVGGAALAGLSSSSSAELLLARYTDATTRATYNWATTGGGTSTDAGLAVAVNGSSVYVAGTFISNSDNYAGFRFGSNGLAGASSNASVDALVACFDVTASSASFKWAQAMGGSGDDQASSLAVSAAGVRLGLGTGTSAATCGTLGLLPYSAAGVATLSSTGTWQRGTATRTATGSLYTRAVTANADGDLLVTGALYGQLVLNNQFYVSQGSSDVFVGKYSPATGTWVWLLTGGSDGADSAEQLALNGSNVYLTGSYTGSGLTPALFGSQQLYGVGQADMLLAKCVDAGSSGSWVWVTGGGGTTYEYGTAVAVSGSSVYMAGSIYNNSANANKVYLCSNALPGLGAVGFNACLAKYTDNGTSVSCNWATVAGSPAASAYPCTIQAVAASGTNVYVTGNFTNNAANSGDMRFGGQPVAGASPAISIDAFLVKYVDGGTKPIFGWSLPIGGNDSDYGTALVANGSNLYLAGSVYNYPSRNTNVQVAGTPLIGAGGDTVDDLLLASFTDQGSSATLNWARADGGTSTDKANGLAVRDGHLYVVGTASNNLDNNFKTQFGGVPVVGTQRLADQDLLVARYTDRGTDAVGDWALVGGGPSRSESYSIAAGPQGVYVAGSVPKPATFGSLVGNPSGNVLAGLIEPAATPLPVQLVAFAATASGMSVRLAWTTAGEVNNSYFAVERSVDGVVFAELSRIAGAGSSVTARTYDYLDGSLPAITSRLYYRLRQVDADNAAIYSPVRAVAVAESSLTLYPNPATHTVTLSGAEAGALIQFYEALGRVVLTARATETGKAIIELPTSLPSGLYLVRSGSSPALRLMVQ